MTHIRPSSRWFACRIRPDFNGSGLFGSVSDLGQGPPSAQSPFAHPRCYLLCRGILYHHVSGRYPTFIARTGSCARPKRSCRHRSPLLRQVFAGCRHSLLRVGPSRRYLCESCSGCLDLYPGGSPGACTRFFPEDFGLHRPESGSALNDTRTATSVRKGFSGLQSFSKCSGLQICSPPRLHLPQSSSRTSRQPWLLRPRISRFVTSPSSGYASRPIPSN